MLYCLTLFCNFPLPLDTVLETVNFVSPEFYSKLTETFTIYIIKIISFFIQIHNNVIKVLTFCKRDHKIVSGTNLEDQNWGLQRFLCCQTTKILVFHVYNVSWKIFLRSVLPSPESAGPIYCCSDPEEHQKGCLALYTQILTVIVKSDRWRGGRNCCNSCYSFPCHTVLSWDLMVGRSKSF